MIKIPDNPGGRSWVYGYYKHVKYVDSTIKSMIKIEFDALTRYEVNMLLATKVMGYGVVPSGIEDAEPITEEGLDMFTGPTDPDASFVEHGTRGSIVHFDPYNDLNDCWKAEEKFAGADRTKAVFYSGIVAGILDRRRPSGTAPFTSGYYPELHADAITRCEALLLAIGEPKL